MASVLMQAEAFTMQPHNYTDAELVRYLGIYSTDPYVLELVGRLEAVMDKQWECETCGIAADAYALRRDNEALEVEVGEAKTETDKLRDKIEAAAVAEILHLNALLQAAKIKQVARLEAIT